MRPRALLVAHLCEEAADLSGWSPLHIAACMDDVEATEALLQAGFSALAEAPLTGATPLSCLPPPQTVSADTSPAASRRSRLPRSWQS